MRFAFFAAALIASASTTFAQETCTQVMTNVTFCSSSANLAGQAGMSTAFPNAEHISLSEEDWKYGSAVAVIPVKIKASPSGQLDIEALTNVLIRNATQELWVDATVGGVRFRNASMGRWPGVQAEYRIVGASKRLGTNYVVDAYLTDDQSVLAIQSFSDADRKVTGKLRAFHKQTMAGMRIAQ